MTHQLPLSTEIPYDDPAALFRIFSDQPWAMILDSADSDKQCDDTNRFTYIAFEPFETILIKDRQRIGTNDSVLDPFQYLQDTLAQYQLVSRPGLPLFQGGAVGYFSYDLCRYFENIPPPSYAEDMVYADLAIGLYATILAFDHVLRKAWVIATGFPATTATEQIKQARIDMASCLERLAQKKILQSGVASLQIEEELSSRFDQTTYAQLVKKAQAYILEGDIYEVNLSHRFEAVLNPESLNHYDVYLKMRLHNPSPFSAYLNLGDHHILSTSPERFLSVSDGRVSTRPIKGTAPRGKTPEEDHALAQRLFSNPKDRSENIMIVDLLRNDLSKVCTAESVVVKKLCEIETYPTVHHLVSVIDGRLRSDKTALDLLSACFPGGSITGAPKIRAMQIIYELEPTARGPYSGSVGYIGYNGTMDTSILIRTILAQGNQISYQAGGAVVLDSSPVAEYEETLLKSIAIRNAFTDQESYS